MPGRYERRFSKFELLNLAQRMQDGDSVTVTLDESVFSHAFGELQLQAMKIETAIVADLGSWDEAADGDV